MSRKLFGLSGNRLQVRRKIRYTCNAFRSAGRSLSNRFYAVFRVDLGENFVAFGEKNRIRERRPDAVNVTPIVARNCARHDRYDDIRVCSFRFENCYD